MPINPHFVDPLPTESPDLFHYTSAGVGIFEIANRGVLRFGPAPFTNDPREFSERYVAVEGQIPTGDGSMELWTELQGMADRFLRRSVRLACFTLDYVRPQSALDPDSDRGWAHPAMWAHYGAAHTGVCLQFDRERLLDAVRVAAGDRALVQAAPVEYFQSRHQVFVYALPWEFVEDFGPDAALKVHVRDNLRELYFFKHADWSYEREYRVVVADDAELPIYVPIADSLKAIFMGPRISPALADLARQVATRLGSIELIQLGAPEGNLQTWPAERFDGVVGTSAFSVRESSLDDRVRALRDSEAYEAVRVRRAQWVGNGGWYDPNAR